MPEKSMSDDETDFKVSAADAEMESALRQLSPRQPAMAVSEIVSEAFRRAEANHCRSRRQLYLWRGMTAALAASLLLTVWLHRPAAVVERIVIRTIPAPAVTEKTDVDPLPEIRRLDQSMTYFVLRRDVLMHGLDALPEAEGPGVDVEQGVPNAAGGRGP